MTATSSASKIKKSWQRFCRRVENVLLHDNWMIGWIDQPIQNSIDWKTCPPVRWIGSRSAKRYIADPFIWPGDPNTILCEDYNYAGKIGTIHKLTLQGTTIVDETRVELSVPGHLSFPFMFEHGGEIYLVPESCLARRLVIYRWHGASNTWQEFVTPLPDTGAADSILFEHDEYFWIAYTDTDLNPFDNLNLCYASSLEGPWQKHPGNPVRRDAHTARCGGTPFRRDGKLYRPAQDCAGTYGGAIHIMEVLECSPTSYREVAVNLIQPEQGINPHGFHTLAACGDKCLVDGKLLMFSPRMAVEKVFDYLQRRFRHNNANALNKDVKAYDH